MEKYCMKNLVQVLLYFQVLVRYLIEVWITLQLPLKLTWEAVVKDTSALSSTFKFSIVTTATKNGTSDVNAWDNVGKEKNIVYTVVPLHKLTGVRISKVGKQEIVTNNSENAIFAASGAAIRADAAGTLQIVKGYRWR